MRKVVILIGIVFFVIASSTYLYADSKDYKALFCRQTLINRGMIATDAMIISWFKEHKDYKKYPSIKKRVDYLYEELGKAKKCHGNTKISQQKGDWRDAYEWAKKEWGHLNNIAVEGKKTQDNLKELEKMK